MTNMALKSFRRTLLSLVWAAVAIPVLILCIYQLRDDYQKRMATDQRELSHSGERTAFALSQALRQVLTDLDRIASDGAVIRSLSMPILSPVTVKKIEEFMGRNPAAVSVMLIDKELFPVEVLPSQALTEDMTPYESYLAKLVESPEVIRDPRPRLFIPEGGGSGAGKSDITTATGAHISNRQPVFVRPILAASNSIAKPFQVDGLLLINLNLSKLMDDMATSGNLDFSWVQLRNGEQVLFTRGSKQRLNHQMNTPIIVGLDGISLVLDVGQNIEGVWWQVIQGYQTQAAIALLFLLLMLVVIKMLADKLDRPLRALTELTSRMSANSFNETTPLPQEPASVQYQEFAEVFGLLGTMEATIRQQFAELHLVNESLETKVAERTAELEKNIHLLDQQHESLNQLVHYAITLQQIASLDDVGNMTLNLAERLCNQTLGLFIARGEFFAGFESFEFLPPEVRDFCLSHRREFQGYTQVLRLAQANPQLHFFTIGSSTSGYQGLLICEKSERSQQVSEALMVLCTILASAIKQHNLHHSLHRMAHMDALTQLPNRHYFSSRLEEKQLQFNAGDARTGFGVFVIDANGLKQINDQYGHQHGDEMLKLVANALRSVVRASDTVARVGGDEFYLLLEAADVATCSSFAERLQEINGKIQLDIDGQKFPVSFSVGFASTDLDSLKNLLILADERMYFAKKKHYATQVE